jgi:rhamnopyranosyl-N-acetylglucosaminyl-diphospho-decaprenol beta-1,3/1,4-galactofuranosyltransferase
MRVLAYIHTFNDADVIEQALEGLRRQTRPPDTILIVDNASTDGTLNRAFSEQVRVIRNPANLATAGAVGIGLGYALEHDFDWMWILDADSVPAPTALEKLLALYDDWPPNQQEQTGFIACLPRAEPDGAPLHGRIFTPHGRFAATPKPDQVYYPCDTTIWAGSMYRLSAVRRIGLPNPDYFIDRDDLAYTYFMTKAGYKGFIRQDAELRQHVSLFSLSRRLKVGPLSLTFYELPPLRCYYTLRNTLYFALYDQAEGRWARFRELWRLRSRPGRSFMSGIAWQSALFTLNFALRPRNHGEHVNACLRGIWHGATGNIKARY